jgi:hypothetical protein
MRRASKSPARRSDSRVPDSRLLVQIDGQTLDPDDLAAIAEIQVEEASDLADAATLVTSITPDDTGEWTSALDALLDPTTPLVIQVDRGAASYRFEGKPVQASWTIDPEGSSQISVQAQDRTVELDAEEKVVAWPGTQDSAIAESILSSYPFITAQVESTTDSPDPDVHIVLQRGSDLAFLRALATKWGFAVFLEATEDGIVGHFEPIDPLADPQGELSLGFGTDSQHVDASVRLTEGERVKLSRIPALSDSAQDADESGDDQAQGAHSLAAQTTVLLAPDDVSGELDPTSTAQAIARKSAFAAELRVEVDADRSDLLLRARKPVLVKGLGSELSGSYLVQRVRHIVTVEHHRQQVTLVRNALGLTGNEPFDSVSGLGGLL